MLVSARQASAILAGVGLSRGSALRVLDSGLAGEPIRTPSALLYQRDRVQRLAASRCVAWDEAVALCPAGLFVARRDLRVGRPRSEQIASLAGGWGGLSPWSWIALHLQIVDYGSVPFIATVAGYVALGADIVATGPRSSLVLGEPGDWFEAVVGCRLPTGRGRPWVLHLGPLAPERIAR